MNHYCIGTSHQTCSWWSETDTKEQGVIVMSCYTLQALNLIKVIWHSTSHLDMQLNAKTKEKDSTLFFSKIEFCNDNNAASHDYDMHVSDLVWFSIDWLIRSCRTLQTNTFINKYLMETYHGLMILDIFVDDSSLQQYHVYSVRWSIWLPYYMSSLCNGESDHAYVYIPINDM